MCSLQGDRSPLHLAAQNGHIDTINILITHGANVDTNDGVNDRYTIIHV